MGTTFHAGFAPASVAFEIFLLFPIGHVLLAESAHIRHFGPMGSRLILDAPQVRPIRGGYTSRTNLWMETASGSYSLVGGMGFHVSGPDRIDSGVAAHFPVALVVAMRLGLPLRVEGELPLSWKANFRRFQEIHRTVFKGFSEVEVDATWQQHRAPDASENAPVGGFFSAGVDAFHVAARPEVRVLIHVDGFDSTVREAASKPVIADVVGKAAAELGLPLWRVSTDARCLLDGLVWHGMAGTTILAGCARLFAGTLGSVVLGASDVWLTQAVTRSDHHLITRCFGAEDLGFTIDGLNRRRVDKIGALGGLRPFREHLRVCWTPTTKDANCGKCEKCLRTMAVVHGFGWENDFPAFPRLERKALEGLAGKISPQSIPYWVEVAGVITERRPDSPLLPVVRGLLDQARAEEWARRLWKLGKGAADAPAWPKLARRILKPVLESQAGTEEGRAWVRKKLAMADRNMKTS
jgi:hypothetical protein